MRELKTFVAMDRNNLLHIYQSFIQYILQYIKVDNRFEYLIKNSTELKNILI